LLQGLTLAFPEDIDYHRWLASTQTSLGSVYGLTNRLERTVEYNRAAIAQLQDRAVRPIERRTLASIYTNLGTVLTEMGKLEPAEKSLLAARDLLQTIIDEFPEEPDDRFHMGILLNSLASIYLQTQRRPEAVETFQQAAMLDRKLADEYPAQPEYRSRLASTQANLGNLLTRINRFQDAETAYKTAHTLMERIVADSPHKGSEQDKMSYVLSGLALLKLNQKKPDCAVAKQLLELALQHNRLAMKAEPKNKIYQQRYRQHHGILTEAMIGLDDHVGAAATAEELVKFGYMPDKDYFTAASVYARCYSIVEEDKKRPEDERKQLTQKYADRTMDFLRSAVQHGFTDSKQIREEIDFKPIENRPDFQRLLRELDAKKPK
jgi:tetratricopeptide (TPR) repeat protein